MGPVSLDRRYAAAARRADEAEGEAAEETWIDRVRRRGRVSGAGGKFTRARAILCDERPREGGDGNQRCENGSCSGNRGGESHACS